MNKYLNKFSKNLKEISAKSRKISRCHNIEFYFQIYYDLGMYKVYREMNHEATEHFNQCKTLHDQLKHEADPEKTGFFKIKEDSLKGFCYACGVTADDNRNLTLQFYSSIRNNYTVKFYFVVFGCYFQTSLSLISNLLSLKKLENFKFHQIFFFN